MLNNGKGIGMGSFRRYVVPLGTGLALILSATPSLAATVVTVDLWDKGANVDMPKGVVYGAPGLDISKATMGMRLSRPSAPAGEVTFNVINSSKDMIHEMIVMYRQDPTALLPFIDNENRVDEDKAGDKGEVSELNPGQSGSLTVTLAPGKYVLVCNVPGHYGAGMWAEFDVTK
jgi:uncharacterized cupredoxin-like copper-binding protein